MSREQWKRFCAEPQYMPAGQLFSRHTTRDYVQGYLKGVQSALFALLYVAETDIPYEEYQEDVSRLERLMECHYRIFALEEAPGCEECGASADILMCPCTHHQNHTSSGES